MNNLAIFTLSMVMAYTVGAQSPINWPNYSGFLSSPYYYHNQVHLTQENTPGLYQNADQQAPHRDAVVSVLIQDLKEMKAVVEDVKMKMANRDEEMARLKSELAQLKMSVDETIEADNLKMNETEIERLSTTVYDDSSTADVNNGAAIPTTRFCNCRLLQQTTEKLAQDSTDGDVKFSALVQLINLLRKDLDATDTKLNYITGNTTLDLAKLDTKFTGITGDIKTDLSTFDTKFIGITAKTNTDLGALDTKFTEITGNTNTELGQLNLKFVGITGNINVELKKLDDKLTEFISKTNTDLTAINVKLTALTTEIAGISEPTSIDRQPTSCTDLKQLGYKNSGIYTVKGNKRMLSVYCDFKKSDSLTEFEKQIGIIDVKTTRVAFHAQRSSSFSTVPSTIPFELFKSNVGNAMSDSTGIFTAPISGTYSFAFSGFSSGNKLVLVELQAKIGSAEWSRITVADVSSATSDVYALHSTLVLNKGDQIRMFLTRGVIFEDGKHYTNFVGFLLEEELA